MILEIMRKRRSNVGAFLLVILAATAAILLGGPHRGDDAVVLAVFVLLTGSGGRSAACLLSILAFVVSFPPLEWPLYPLCFTPLAWLWRRGDPSAGGGWFREAFGAGFAMCWLSSPFVRADFPNYGLFIQVLASAIFGLQLAGIGRVLTWSRDRSLLASAPLAAVAATLLEVARVYTLGWPLLALGFPAAPTPLAQWARFATPFGVSWILYTINFLCVPEGSRWTNPRTWLGPCLALGLGALSWLGGRFIRDRVPVEPVPLTALVVQPHRVVPDTSPGDEPKGLLPVATQLDRMTREAMENGPPVDLIVWPEAVIVRDGRDPGPPGRA
jgi:apolipoprotein N-acyltransferase